VPSLTYGENYFIWSSHFTNTNSISLLLPVLLGNLVVRDQVNSSVVVWQSSDRPTDVLLAGGQLGFNPIALY
jgi:hypothetical protein